VSTSAQVITSSFTTLVQFDPVAVDTPGDEAPHADAAMADLTNAHIVARYSGLYIIHGYVQFSADSDGSTRQLMLKVNGTTWIARAAGPVQTYLGITPSAVHIHCAYTLDPGDYVDLWALHDAGAGVSLLATEGASRLEATWASLQ
ncbi:hypothetical protein LCGC14_2588960, partial [marine sediment metagenome]